MRDSPRPIQIHRHSIIRGPPRGVKGGGFSREGEGGTAGHRCSFKVDVDCYLDFDKKRFKTGWMTDRFSRKSTQTTRIATHAAPILVIAITTQSISFEA